MKKVTSKKGKRTDQFCIRKHDTFIFGRYKDGKCKECVRIRQKKAYIPHPLKPIQFCPQGHDTFVTGRDKNGRGCSECRLERRRKYKPGERPKKQFCINNHDTFICGRLLSNGTCNDCSNLAAKEYYKEHREERLQKQKEYAKNNSDLIKEQKKTYFQKHKTEINMYLVEKRKIDPNFKIAYYLRIRLRLAVKSNQKVGSAVRDLGCSIPFFKDYIEDLFYGEMTWENWGKVWQLDHIIPLWKFDLEDREQLLIACNYKNMQPLTISEHRKKTSKETRQRAKLKGTNGR